MFKVEQEARSNARSKRGWLIGEQLLVYYGWRLKFKREEWNGMTQGGKISRCETTKSWSPELRS